jgi:hypothetical protein
MSKQHEITERIPLLKDNGTITEEGWAKHLLWDYDRKKIQASWLRIKEWDYYYIIDHQRKYGLTVTMSDLGYAGLMAVCWLDFKRKEYAQTDTLALLPRGKIGFPPNSNHGIIKYRDRKMRLKFNYSMPKRHLTIDVPEFEWKGEKINLMANLSLHQNPELESMVIATSWEENRKAFYYNQKINCMPAKGHVKLGDKRFEFSPDNAMGGLDWGRGRWTYKNRWYWGSASGHLNGKSIGWNIGYGFTDRTPASENMIFYEGKAHKLDEVTFEFNEENYKDPWKFTSNDGRFEMKFEPIIDRYSIFNVGIIKSEQHQVFGYFNGTVSLDDGKTLQVKNFLGFAEDVYNKW